MKQPQTTHPISPSVRRWRRWLLSLTILLLLVSLLLVTSPYFIGKSIEGFSRKGGFGNATVGRVEFNPLIGTLVLRDFVIEKEGVTNLTVDEVRIWLHWMPLFQKRLVVQELSVHGLKTTVSRSSDGIVTVAGVSLGADTEDGGDLEWGLGLETVSLSKIDINYHEAGQSLGLKIERAGINRLQSWNPDSPIEVNLDGQLNGAAISIEGRTAPLAQPLTADLRLETGNLDLKRLAGLVVQQGTDIQGQASIKSRLILSHTPDKTSLSSQGALVLKQLELGLDGESGMRLALDADLSGLLKLEHSPKGSVLTQEGRLGVDELLFYGDDSKLVGKSGRWEGAIEARLPAREKTLLKASGTLSIEGLTAKGFGQNAEIQLGVLDLRKGQIELLGAGERITHASQIDIRDVAITGQEFDIRERQLSWHGEFEVSSTGSETSQRNLAVAGSVKSDLLSLALEQRPLDMSLSGLGFEGELKLGQEEMLSGELSSGSLELKNRDSGQQVAGWDTLQAAQLKSDDLTWFESSEVMVNRLVLGLPEVAKADSEMIRVERLVLENPGYSEVRGVSIRRLLADTLRMVLKRGPEGEWNFQRMAEALASDDSETEPSNDNGDGMPIVIDQLEASGDSRLVFEDRSVEPVYQLDAQISELSISGLDSNTQDELSPLKLVLKPSEHSSLEAEGGLQLFARQPAADLKFTLSALELPPLSAYTGKLLGYNLDSGQMDAEAGLKIDAGKLDGLVELELHQLEVSPLSEEARKRLDSQMSVPLDTGLSMLRDKQNSIRLKMPISGDSANPEFDFSDAINQAMGKAVKKGAFTYLATALQPFGTLLAIAQMAGDAANAIRLDPLTYVAGSDEPEKSPNAYLVKVAEVMNERPEIRIRLCGFAVQQDRVALISAAEANKKQKGEKGAVEVTLADEILLQLAARRADAVKSALSKRGIDPSRLINCAPIIDPDAQGEPRVDLLI